MADAISLQLAQRAPNGFRPHGLTSVHSQTQAVSGRVRVYLAKLLRSGAAFVAPEANPDHVSILETHGLFDHALRLLHSEVPHCVEDPVQRHSKVTLATLSSSLRAFKERREFL